MRLSSIRRSGREPAGARGRGKVSVAVISWAAPAAAAEAWCRGLDGGCGAVVASRSLASPVYGVGEGGWVWGLG